MRRKMLYSAATIVVLALLTGAVIASLFERPDLSSAAIAALGAAACLMLLERRWALQQSAARLELVAKRVQRVARRADLELALKSLGAVSDHSSRVDESLESLARHQENAAHELEAISRRNQNFHTEVRTGLRDLRHEPLILQIAALLQLQHRFKPAAPLIAAGAWALSPTVVVEIVDTIARKQPRLVLECGSGLSTVWLGYAIRQVGHGRLVALEHNETYRDQTVRMVEQHGLTDFVEVRHAPLAPVRVAGEEMPWYSASIGDLQEIGVLLVDGPPASTGASARYPAMPILRDRLAPGAAVILDDIVREDERAVVSRWLAEDPTLSFGHEIPGGSLVLHAE